MTTAEIEALANEKWNTDTARVIGDRIAGNRTASAVIDSNGNFMPLTWRPGEGYCPPMCACDDLMDCPIPADNPARDWADTRTEGMGA